MGGVLQVDFASYREGKLFFHSRTGRKDEIFGLIFEVSAQKILEIV